MRGLNIVGILSWIILGGLAGWIASALLGEKHGCIMNVIIGIVGAVVGGLVFNLLGGRPVIGFGIYSLVVAVVGAVIFLGIVRLFRGGPQRR